MIKFNYWTHHTLHRLKHTSNEKDYMIFRNITNTTYIMKIGKLVNSQSSAWSLHKWLIRSPWSWELTSLSLIRWWWCMKFKILLVSLCDTTVINQNFQKQRYINMSWKQTKVFGSQILDLITKKLINQKKLWVCNMLIIFRKSM